MQLAGIAEAMPCNLFVERYAYGRFLRVIDSITPHVVPHKVFYIFQEARHWCVKILIIVVWNHIAVVIHGVL
jgi:hypothetical protein